MTNPPELRPTAKQIEVYALIYIYGCKQVQAAAMLGCSTSTICNHLKRLKKKRPELFAEKLTQEQKKPIRFNNQSGIKHQF